MPFLNASLSCVKKKGLFAKIIFPPVREAFPLNSSPVHHRHRAPPSTCSDTARSKKALTFCLTKLTECFYKRSLTITPTREESMC